MKVYFISYNPNSNSIILNDRIKSLGDYYCFKPTQFFVQSPLQTAEEVFRVIAKDDFARETMLIIAVDSTAQTGYWGIEKKELWTWLKEHTSQM